MGGPGSGGARMTSGPPPDENSIRTQKSKNAGGWVSLPAHGRQGAEPEWPLDPEATEREARVWSQMWRCPQAVMWDAQGQHIEVAIYVRQLGEAEKPNAPGTTRRGRAQQADALGLTLPAMQRLRWRIAEAARTPEQMSEMVEAAGYGPQPPPRTRGRARDRFGVVPPAGE